MEKSEIISAPRLCCWDKTRLENVIFARAAREGMGLVARGGRFQVAAASSHCLRRLVRVYNHFFSAANRLFLATDLADTYAVLSCEEAAFSQEKKRNPLAPSFYLSCTRKSFSDKW